MITGTVTGVEGSIIKVKALGNDYEPKAFFGCGVENNPAIGERVLLINSNGNLYAIGGCNNDISVIAKTGERRIYSIKDNDVGSQILWGNDGTLSLNDADTWAVRYAELKTELDKLKETLNSHISKYNLHTHAVGAVPATATISTAVTTSLSTSNTSDFTKVKSNNVKLS